MIENHLWSFPHERDHLLSRVDCCGHGAVVILRPSLRQTYYATYGDLKALSHLELEGAGFAEQFDAALGNNPRDGESFWMDEETARISFPSNEYVLGFWEAAHGVFVEIEDKL
jgi:hypothetical protein